MLNTPYYSLGNRWFALFEMGPIQLKGKPSNNKQLDTWEQIISCMFELRDIVASTANYCQDDSVNRHSETLFEAYCLMIFCF